MTGKRRYPVPAVLLARLAVNQSYQGLGLGARLLIDALGRVAEASRSVGFEILVVHAIDQEASTFYRRYGFTPFADHDLHLFMPVANLRLTLETADRPERRK